MENIVLKASDGYALSLAVFEREHPRGYIQIIHGMEEHKERYEAFAEQLRQAGFTVVTSDMRGHGEHAPKLGFFKEKTVTVICCRIRYRSRHISGSGFKRKR